MECSYIVIQSVADWTTKEDGLSSKSKSFKYIRSSSYSSVQVDFTSPSDCLHHVGQHVQLNIGIIIITIIIIVIVIITVIMIVVDTVLI